MVSDQGDEELKSLKRLLDYGGSEVGSGGGVLSWPSNKGRHG